HQRLGMLGYGKGLIWPLVVHTEATAYIKPFDAMAAFAQPVDERNDLLHRLNVRLDLIDGRADVDVDAADAQILEGAILLKYALGALDVHAKFRLLLARRRLDVRLGIDIGIDANCTNGFFADGAGDAV